MLTRFIQENLLHWYHHSKHPLILLGARQVGKTWLAKDLSTKIQTPSHYFNFEEKPTLVKAFDQDLDPITIKRNLELSQKVPIGPEDLLIFDEIQSCPKALTSLKYFAENSTNHVLAAGSLLGVHLSEDSFPVGLVEFLTLYPLTFEEFLINLGKEDLLKNSSFKTAHSQLITHLYDFFYTGGMPAAVMLWKSYNGIEQIQKVRKCQQDILLSYEKDFAKHAGKENALHLSELFSNIAGQLVRYQDDSVERYQFKGALSGKKEYRQFKSLFSWLERCGLIYRSFVIESEPQFPLSMQKKESLFKAFYFDIGLLNAKLKIGYGVYKSGDWSQKGFILENFVATQLAILTEGQLYSWKTAKSTAEIEFLWSDENEAKIYPIEVKSQARTKAKSLMSFTEQFKPNKAFKLTLDHQMSFNPLSKIQTHPLYDIRRTLFQIT